VAENALIPGKPGWVPYLPPSRSGRWPWSHTKTWCWGLVAFIVVATTTIVWSVPWFESRLDTLSKTRMANAGIDAASLNFRWDYRDLTVTGELPPGVTAEQFATVVRQGEQSGSALFATGIRKLRLNLSQPDPELARIITKDQLLNVNVEAGETEATLSGTVETEAQRDQLVGALLVSGVERINDNLEVVSADEANNGSDAKVSALAAMLELTGPKNVAFADMKLDQDNLGYRIMAKNKAAAEAIEDAATVTVLEFRVTGEIDYLRNGEVDVMASSDGERMTIKGQVLSEEQQRRLSFAANEAIGADQVTNEIRIVEQSARIAGADERINRLSAIVARFSSDVVGEVGLKGTNLSLNALVGDSAVQSSLMEVTAVARAEGITVAETISLRGEGNLSDMATLQLELDRLAEEIRANVVFNSGKADLTPVAMNTLDKVVEQLNRFPRFRVEVEGHTDNVGRERVNEKISQLRAAAVKNYLTSREVPETRLVAVGYGQRRPVESNDTALGRQRNRRVHFNVITQSN